MIKVSIIIPIYNTEEYLSECLNSIINQTLKDIEIILVNDGSSDDSGKICDEYALKDKRIKVIHQKNLGVSYARNRGIEKAQGEYIYFVDSDDYLINNDFLENAYNTAIKKESDIVVVAWDVLFCEKFNVNNLSWFATWNGFIKRKFLNNNKIYFPEKLNRSEDAIFSFKLLSLTDKITNSNDTKYFYRKRKEQATQKKIELKILIPNILRIFEEFFNEYNLWEQKSKNLLSFIVEIIFFNFLDRRNSLREKIEIRNLIKKFLKQHNLKFKNFWNSKKRLQLLLFYYCPSYLFVDFCIFLYYWIYIILWKNSGKNNRINWNYLWKEKNYLL